MSHKSKTTLSKQGGARAGGGGSAPAQDPKIGEYYESMGGIAQEMWDASKPMIPALQEQVRFGLDASRAAEARAAEQYAYQRDRGLKLDKIYDDEQLPLERAMRTEAMNFDEDANRNRMTDAAVADVSGAFSTARGVQMRNLERSGINPASGRAMAAGADMSIEEAKARVNAANKTRLAVKQLGWQMKGQAAGLGNANAGLAWGTAATGASDRQASYGMGGSDIIGRGISGINSTGSGAYAGFGGAAGGLNNLYGNQLQAYQTQQANDPTNAILGAAVGAGMLMLSDRRAKTDITRVGTLDNGLPVYRFRYVHGGPYVTGVMADEVAVIAPHAYVRGGPGQFDRVDYSKL